MLQLVLFIPIFVRTTVQFTPNLCQYAGVFWNGWIQESNGKSIYVSYYLMSETGSDI
jgi:hypothetical protein